MTFDQWRREDLTKQFKAWGKRKTSADKAKAEVNNLQVKTAKDNYGMKGPMSFIYGKRADSES